MKVFLSHASQSKARVRGISDAFPRHVEVWLDQDELPPGAQLELRIEQAIQDECDFVIVFVDADALASSWVKREVGLSLQRKADLKREFLLPVLLEDVGARLSELGPLEGYIYLRAFDHSDDGLARAGRELCDQLFALASRLIEALRSEGRRRLLRQFDADLTRYKQASFLWLATLRKSLAVLSTNQAAFDHVKQALAEYNEVADVFIPSLGRYRDRITSAWRAHRGLAQEFRELTAKVENVYRGAMFSLNDVLTMMQSLEAEAGAEPEPIEALDARKDALLAQADAALHQMATASTELVAQLEREIY